MKPIDATFSQVKKYLDKSSNIKEKQYFAELLDIIAARYPLSSEHSVKILDIGCAGGDFLHFLCERKPEAFSCCGIDVFPELLAEAVLKVPRLETIVCSALELPEDLNRAFDVVTALGLLTMFRAEQLHIFFSNIRRLLRDGGTAVVFSPFNKYGVDIHVDHRARIPDEPFAWTTGFNCFSFETIGEIVSPLFSHFEFVPFMLKESLKKGNNPLHSWTIQTESDARQHIVGLNLLLDRYYLILKA